VTEVRFLVPEIPDRLSQCDGIEHPFLTQEELFEHEVNRGGLSDMMTDYEEQYSNCSGRLGEVVGILEAFRLTTEALGAESDDQK